MQVNLRIGSVLAPEVKFAVWYNPGSLVNNKHVQKINLTGW